MGVLFRILTLSLSVYAQSDDSDQDEFRRKPQLPKSSQEKDLIKNQSEDSEFKRGRNPRENMQGEFSNSASSENIKSTSPHVKKLKKETEAVNVSKDFKKKHEPIKFEDFFPSFIYDERGRKDPFSPYIPNVTKKVVQEIIREGLLKYDLTELNVTTIVVGKTKSKALIKDPENKIYVVFENDEIGRNNGIIRKIRPGQIIVVEKTNGREGKPLYTTKVLSMKK